MGDLKGEPHRRSELQGEEFLTTLRARFYPAHLQQAKLEEFTRLNQGSMDVEEYYEKFTVLAQSAPGLVETEEAKISKFKLGLNQHIKSALSQFTREIATLQDLYEKAVNIYRVNKGPEGYAKQDRDGSDSSKGKGKWQANRGNVAARGSYQGGRPWTPNRPPARVPPSGHYLAPCPKCGKAHPSTDCEGRPISCFNCGRPGHRANVCPHPRDDKGKRPDFRQGGRGQGRLNVMTADEAAQEGNVITGTFSVLSYPVRVLFDSGASCSFISLSYAQSIGLSTVVPISVDVALPSGSMMHCSSRLVDVPIRIEGMDFPADLVCFPLSDFDVILGMDWLKCYKANLDCNDEKVHLRAPDGSQVSYRRYPSKPPG